MQMPCHGATDLHPGHSGLKPRMQGALGVLAAAGGLATRLQARGGKGEHPPKHPVHVFASVKHGSPSSNNGALAPPCCVSQRLL